MGFGARLALRLKPFERRPRLGGARLNITRRTLPRGLSTTARSSWIVRQFLLEGGQPLGGHGFDLEQFFARLERPLAGAGANLRAVDGDLGERHQSLADQRGHTLRQQPVENSHLLGPEVGEPVIVQRHAARPPAIGGVAFGEALQFARRPDPFNRRIEPQRQQDRGIGRRPSRLPVARLHPLIQLRKIEALDETPDDARPRIRRQKPLKIDHIPAQLPRSGRTTRASLIADSPHTISDRESQHGQKDHFFTRSFAGMTSASAYRALV